MHAIHKINIGMARRAKHDGVTRCLAPMSVGARILARPVIRLDLGQDEGDSIAGEGSAQQPAGSLLGRSRQQLK
jgi:hypothetical protein